MYTKYYDEYTAESIKTATAFTTLTVLADAGGTVSATLAFRQSRLLC